MLFEAETGMQQIGLFVTMLQIMLIIGSLNFIQVFIQCFDVATGHHNIKKNKGLNAKMQVGFKSGPHRVQVKL